MAEEELRSRNRDLISRLYASQRFVRQSTESVKTLVRGLDDLQVNIDRVKNFNSRDLGYDGGGDPFLPSQSRSSLDISAANVNNNNMTQLRRTCLWPEEKLAMDSSYQLQRADSPQLQETVSPQLQKTASPQFKDSGVLKDKLNDLQVVKTSPETSREIRRKLAEEMVCEESCPSLNDTIGDLDPPRASFKNVTNTTHAPPAADNIIHTPSAAKSTKSVYETPKSILKHRRLIDSNVQVESKFVHTPGWMDRAKRTRTRAKNPSKAKSHQSENICLKSVVRRLPSAEKTEIEELKGVSFVSDCQNKPNGDISILRSNVDNIRSSASQSSIRDQVEKTSSDHNTMSTPTSLSKVRGSPVSTPTRNVMKQRLMGYDWIAALLDQSTESEVTDKHESYFRELKEFRRLHSDECRNDVISGPGGSYGHLSLVDTDNIQPIISETASPNHTCIHSFTVNPRLYAVPVNSDKSGASRCAVCNKKKHLPSTTSPGFVRVSIPRCTLSSPHKVKPHRRKSFNPSDSVALSKHCLKGWVHQRPLKLPLGRNVDLANETKRLKSKFTMTMAEAEDLARKSKASVAVSSRELDQTTLYKREIKNITNQLLGMSHSMQFQSQLLNKTPIH